MDACIYLENFPLVLDQWGFTLEVHWALRVHEPAVLHMYMHE